MTSGVFLQRKKAPDPGLNRNMDAGAGYLPKGTDLRKVTDAEVRSVQDRTDARPGKALACLTPDEAFRLARPP